jgi:hypothetical protein
MRTTPRSRGYVVEKPPAGPAKKRSSRLGFLFLGVALLLFCIGFFTDNWISQKDVVPQTDISYGLWNQKVTTKSDGKTTVVYTPIRDVDDQNIPQWSKYDNAATTAKGLGFTAIILGGLAALLSFPVMISIGPAGLDLFSVLVMFLSTLFAFLTYIIYDIQRPKSGDGGWDNFSKSSSFYLVLAGSILSTASLVFFFLGKR